MACKEDEEQWRRGSEEEPLGRLYPPHGFYGTCTCELLCILVVLSIGVSAPRWPNPPAARCPGETENLCVFHALPGLGQPFGQQGRPGRHSSATFGQSAYSPSPHSGHTSLSLYAA